MRLFELIDHLETLRKYGDCEVAAEDGALSLMQDVVVRIVCDERSKYALGNPGGQTITGQTQPKGETC